MRVLALCSYPQEAAATRFRLMQYIEPLRERNIELSVSAFLTSQQMATLYREGSMARKAVAMLPRVAERAVGVGVARNYDLLFVQREAMIFGPGLFEWLYKTIGRVPMVLDLDDATYIRYISPTYGKLGSLFKFFGKTDNLIKRSSVVVCGNRSIAEYVESLGAKTAVIPTVVDTEKFRPAANKNGVPLIGWIGTHSTYQFLKTLFPVLQQLAKKHNFVLRIVGSGNETISVKGVEVENLNWDLEREVEDFRGLDIGLYPLATTEDVSHEWIMGKSGFKAIQYMAVGVPFVMTPIGVCAELGEVAKTHFIATTEDEWFESLDKLLSNPELRSRMGAAGREHSLAHYTVSKQADLLADVMEGAVESKNE
jgi:glycosyltransferase involved in cell wall biosynthesis